MESNKTEREKIDLSSSHAQNPSNTGAVTAILELNAPEITGFRAGTENHKNRRRQRKKERKEKVNSASLFQKWWRRKPHNHPGAPESNAPLDFNTWPKLTDINNITEDVLKSGSQELTLSTAPNVPAKHSVSAEILSAEEFRPAPNIENGTVKETDSSFQDLTIPSAPDAPVKYPTIAAPAEECLPLPNIQENTRKETESGIQDLPTSSALNISVEHSESADVSPAEQLPALPKINDNTETKIRSGCQGSQEVTASSKPHIPIEQYASPDTLPVKENPPLPNVIKYSGEVTGSGSWCSQELTAASLPKVPVKDKEWPDAPVKYITFASPAGEFPPPPCTEENTKNETESGSQELNNSSALNVSVEHSASADVSPASPKIYNNTETGTESGSQQLTASSKPHTPVELYVSSDALLAEQNPPIQNVSKNSGKVTESGFQCSQELTVSSLPKVPVKDSASADVLPSKQDTETMDSNKTERERIGLSSSHAQNPSNTREATEILEHNSRSSQRQKEKKETNINNNTEEVMMSSSQELTVSSAPNVPVTHSMRAEILSAKEFRPAANIEEGAVKQTESSFHELVIPTAPDAPVQNPSNTPPLASPSKGEMKAPAIIVSRAKVPEEPWMATDWVPPNDNIHPSAEEIEAGLTFEQLYNIIRHRDGSPPPSPNSRRLSVFKEIYN